MEKPKILIVKAEEKITEVWIAWLDDKVKVISAKTLAEGERLFKENSDDIELVLVDCCVPDDTGDEPNSMGLVEKIRQDGFKGPIIAESSNPENYKSLRDAGADRTASVFPPREVPELILELLGLK